MAPDRMPLCGQRTRLIALPAVLALAYVLAPPTTAHAQGFGPDPYRPYNSRYDPFVYPVAPGDLDYGYNQGFAPAARNGTRNANQFQNYLDTLRGPGNARTGGGTGAGAGTPYYRSDRSIDREYDRVYQYRPNRQADSKFETNQEEVSKLYFQYLREKDPKRRAELFREYSRARNQADRAISGATGSRTKGAGRSARKDAAPRPDDRGARDATGAEAAPPIDGVGTRGSRARRGGRNEPSTGPAPPATDDPGSAAAATSEGATPSRVLDRALRTAPPGRGPTRRSTAPPPLGAAPPP